MSPTPKTIAGIPRSTFLFLCALALIAAILFWFRFFYHQLLSPSSASPTPAPSYSSIPRPVLPTGLIQPLTISHISLSTQTSLPLSMDIIPASPSSQFKNIASHVAKEMKLLPVVSTSPNPTFKNNLATLIVDTQNQSLTYFLNAPLPPSANTSPPNPDQSAPVVQSLLQSFQLWTSNLTFNSQATIFLQAGSLSLVPIKSPQNANLIQLSYQYLVNSLPVIISNEENPVSFQVFNNSQVESFVLYPFAVSLGPGTKYPLISPNQIPAFIQNQTARLISLSPHDYVNPPTAASIDTFTITSLAPVYFFSPTQNLLYPSFLIKGEAQFSDSTRAGLTFLLPAIDSRYYR